jgi:hypothetical protein
VLACELVRETSLVLLRALASAHPGIGRPASSQASTAVHMSIPLIPAGSLPLEPEMNFHARRRLLALPDVWARKSGLLAGSIA